MKRTILLINAFVLVSCSSLFAQITHQISIGPSNTYSPAEKTILVGDKVNFPASSFHPFTEVSKATWDVNGTSPKTGAFAVEVKQNFTQTFDKAGEYFYVCTNHGGGGMKGKITVNVPLGIINSSASSSDFKIFPNPSEESTTLIFKEGTQVQSISLVNSQGIEVFSNQVNSFIQEYTLNTSNLETGFYQVIISSSDKKLFSRIIIK